MRDDLYLIQVGKRIREMRKAKGMSLRTMFKLTGFSRDNLGRIEFGQKNFHILTLKRIAEALEVDIIDLIQNE